MQNLNAQLACKSYSSGSVMLANTKGKAARTDSKDSRDSRFKLPEGIRVGSRSRARIIAEAGALYTVYRFGHLKPLRQ